MTQIVESPNARGTHALVIGIGEYPWLHGGTQQLFVEAEGMGQLTSPPVSARAFADWLLRGDGYRNPQRPLASLDLLISDSATDQFTLPSGVSKSLERANFKNIEKAVRAWLKRANDPDDLLLFFFCGHGIARGSLTTLLPEDYGSLQDPPQSSFELAIDFDGLYQGLDSCLARNQIFFVDACRVASGSLMRTLNAAGRPIIPPMARLSTPPRNAPVFYGTVPGSAAFGRPGQPSYFSEALLKAFRGAGADDESGRWAVQTDTMHRGIRHLLRRAVSDTAASGQTSLADHVGDPLVFHQLNGLPECPVDVQCDPEALTSQATLGVSGNGINHSRTPDTAPWSLDLTLGEYQFDARIANPLPQSGNCQARIAPPYRSIRIRVR